MEESDAFASAFAETNADSSDSVDDIDFVSEETLAQAQGWWPLNVYASVSLAQDNERPYAGHQVSMTGQLNFPKQGRRLLGAWMFDEIDASAAHYADAH